VNLVSIHKRLQAAGLKDTLPRQTVLAVLQAAKTTLSPAQIAKRTAAKKQPVNLVTVYRILNVFEQLGIVHRHPCSGQYTLCQLDASDGHHGFLHCQTCGKTEEFLSDELCSIEGKIARSSGFRPLSHVAEIVGVCRFCSA
jgi:Fur family ferric uptake transcriptional regulator